MHIIIFCETHIIPLDSFIVSSSTKALYSTAIATNHARNHFFKCDYASMCDEFSLRQKASKSNKKNRIFAAAFCVDNERCSKKRACIFGAIHPVRIFHLIHNAANWHWLPSFQLCWCLVCIVMPCAFYTWTHAKFIDTNIYALSFEK